METQRNQLTGNSEEDLRNGNVNGASQPDGENKHIQTASAKEASGYQNVVPPAGKVRSSSQRKTNSRKALLKSVTEFAYNVSVVGLRYVANASASPFRRWVWVMLILVGAAFTTYQILTRIQRYISHPVNVIIHVQHEREMRFPTVTICNENRALRSKVSTLGK